MTTNTRSLIVAATLGLAALVSLAGCGDNDSEIDLDIPRPTQTAGGTTPVPTPTPGPATATAVATTDPTATPDDGETPTPEPTGAACTGSEVTVGVAIDAAYGAARIDLQYPSALINLPGSGTVPSVTERVSFAGSGLTTVNDDDNASTLTMSLVSFTEQAAGPFTTITYDCVGGVPAPSAFTCTVVSASSPGGVALDAGCTVSVE